MKFIYLLQLSEAGNSRQQQIEEGSTLLVGRNGGDAQLQIDNAKVSRRHLSLFFQEGRVKVNDLGSSNGSYIENERLQASKTYALQAGQKLYLLEDKSIYIEVKIRQENESEQTGRSGSKEPVAAQGLLALLQQKNEIIIGRNSDCDIVIDDRSVSRRHAKVFMNKGKVCVQDLQSSNGVFINNRKVRGIDTLGAQDTLYIGLHAFRLGEAAIDLSKEHAIVTHHIVKVFSNGYTGLQPANIQIAYQTMVALMGPSGCGKSTLLKAINGDAPPSQGTVKIFGLDMAEHFEMLKHIIGYVPQDNIVHEDLTVEQSLFYAAKLRLSADLTAKQVEERIAEVLDALKINTPVIRQTKVAKLSGGQKKRVSIAVELLTRPKILFLDEPTSPLDPETIEEFLLCLKGLCQNGTTVVMVTHKPEDLNYVDSVIFMGVGGHLVYEGNKEQLLPHFGADRLIRLYSILSKAEETKKWYQQWSSKIAQREEKSKKISLKQLPVNHLQQSYWLSRRYLSVKMGNLTNLAIILLQPVLIAILIMLAFGGLFKIDSLPDGSELKTPNLGILFLMSIAAIWFGVSNSAKEIVGEKEILKREFMFNMKLGNYLLSKVLVLLLISAVQITILQALLYLKFNDLGAFPATWTFLLLVSLCSIHFGLLLSVVSSTTEEVMSILPIALMPQIILAGMIQPIENQITMFLSYFTLGRWGTEGAARIQDFGNEDKPFMSVLDKHLYSDEVSSIFPTDGFEANIFFLMLLLLLMLAAVYGILLNKLKN